MLPEVIELSAEYVADRLDALEALMPGIRSHYESYIADGGCKCCWEDDYARSIGYRHRLDIGEWLGLRWMAGEDD